jgi:hypothetical protein
MRAATPGLLLWVIGCASACTVDSSAWPAGDPVVKTAAAQCGAGKVVLARAEMPDEAYELRRRGDALTVIASSKRGLLFGAYAAAGGAADGRYEPRFGIREWWSAAFQANFNLPLGGAFDRPIEEISSIVRRTIHEAPRYGINTLQLMGRAGEGGIDLSWFLRYDAFPKLQSVELGWGRERRTEEIRALAREAHRYGLQTLLWDHELVFPDRMLEAYPEMRGVDYPVCFSSPLVMQFLNAKVDEFFKRLPEIDGIDLTFAETRGYNILEHSGCKCEKCSRTSNNQKIRAVVMAMYEACRRNGKRLEVRSYNQRPEHARVMLRALKGLPPDIPIITKSTIVDFRGTAYPEDPMLGAFSNQKQVIELTATPEGSGYGYIPALLGDFYQREIGKVATQKKLAGVAIRTDYHLQYGHATFFNSGPPVLTFDTPNGFNIEAASRLAWDPTASVDGIWREWTRKRYGAEAAPAVERALRRTATISEGIFFVKGFSLLTHLNMPPHLAYIDGELDHSYLLDLFPENAAYRRAYQELKRPSAQTLAEILGEKQAASDAARASLLDIASVRGHLTPSRYAELEHGLTAADDAAQLWKRIAAVYFQMNDQKKLAIAVRELVGEACRIESQRGQVWPVYPAARGTTVYRLAEEALERGHVCCVNTSCQ